MEENYYVYIFLDPRKQGEYIYGEYSFKYEPFYVGKGRYKRLKSHLYPASLRKSSYKNNKLNKIIKDGFDPLEFSLVIQKDMSNKNALSLELEMIKLIGRTCDGGTLTNIALGGGEGTEGSVRSESSKKNMSNIIKRWRQEHPEEVKIQLEKATITKKEKREANKHIIKRYCSVDGCENKHRSSGYCNKHYKAFKKYGDPLESKIHRPPKICSVEGCGIPLNSHAARGLCAKHYLRYWKFGNPLQISAEGAMESQATEDKEDQKGDIK